MRVEILEDLQMGRGCIRAGALRDGPPAVWAPLIAAGKVRVVEGAPQSTRLGGASPPTEARSSDSDERPERRASTSPRRKRRKGNADRPAAES